MALAVGTRLGPYEVLAFIGAGGMGEVYKARDTELGRDIAIKLLPPAFVGDAERVARFRREAQALAALNHPHIAQIHGLEAADGNHLLVLELVDGENLSTRLARGPIPLDETLSIASQVAEALEAAHERGIVHRDLKPANVGLTRDGQVKVLDFGLAKALGPPGEASPLSATLANSPTISSPAVTGVGVLLGTAAYMAPEQAKGRPADKRADIWAFGCVLYEMLTAKRAFAGEDVSDTLAAILRGEPDWAALPADVPSYVRAVLTDCLQKDRRRRFSEIAIPRYLLERPSEPTASARSGRRRPSAVSVAAGALALVVIFALLAALLVVTRGHASPSAVVTRFSLPLGEGQRFTNPGRQSIAASPDGDRIVYVANKRLYLRDMSALVARPIPGAEGSDSDDLSGGLTSPVFSPDGQEVAYYTAVEHALKRIPIAGGAAVTICHLENPSGVSWQSDQILFGQGTQGIMRVVAKGGEPERIVTVQSGERAASPQMLPDGDHLLYSLGTGSGQEAWNTARTVVQSLKTGKRTIVVEGAADARYVPTGHLVYALNGVLFARPFDAKRLVAGRSPVAVVEGVRRSWLTGVAQFAFSTSGTLVYIPGPLDEESAGQNDLILFDRSGKFEPLPLPADHYVHPRISPDGTRVAFGTDDGKDAIVWVYDLAGGTTRRRLTFDGGNRTPIWTPDGLWIAFQSDRGGDRAIFRQRADGSGTAERLTTPEPGTFHTPQSWSHDGGTLLFSIQKDGRWGLAVLSMKDRTVTPYGGISSRLPPAASFSPDARFVLYAEASKTEMTLPGLFVQPYPATGAKYQLTEGLHALWLKKDEIFAITGLDGPSIMNVIEKPSFAITKPVRIARSAPGSVGYVGGAAGERNLDVMPDGKRLVLVGRHVGETGKQEIVVVERWFDELNTRVAVK